MTNYRIPIFLLAVCAMRGETGSQVCATCHREIFDTYRLTGMARSSGEVTTIETEGSFSHQPSSVRYSIDREDGAARFTFDLPGIHGSRRLDYFIGSGTVGRSYLYVMDGFLYQAPVSWYTALAKWDLSPGYQQYDHLFLTRAIETVCLQCHASRLQPAAGTANGYRSPPFLEGGVSCERCHGPGDAHVAGRGKMINPAKLASGRRDSVCAQCHLSGEARIARAGAQGAFQPGSLLSDSLVVFEWSGNPDMNVTSHFERLAESACKRASGDRLWCGSCHNPHRAPAAAERAAFYRARCLQCHQTAECSRGPDCAGCHMPKKPVRDVQHSAYTDHNIRKPAALTLTPVTRERKLVPFGGVPAGDREFGLAYASLPGFEKQALQFLERAYLESPQGADAEVLVRLGYLYEKGGNPSKAAPLYERALELDPSQVAAAVNLGNLYIKDGRTGEAIRLWRYALERSPGLETVRLSQAVALYRGGDSAGAEGSLLKLLELNPGNSAARKLLNGIRSRR